MFAQLAADVRGAMVDDFQSATITTRRLIPTRRPAGNTDCAQQIPFRQRVRRTTLRMVRRAVLVLAVLLFLALLLPAAAYGLSLFGIGVDLNPTHWAQGIATYVINELLKVIFGQSPGDLLRGLIPALVALPLLASGYGGASPGVPNGPDAAYAHVGTYESWAQGIGWALLPLFMVGAASHYMSVSISGEGDAYTSAKALGRGIFAGAAIVAWPHVFDLGERLVNTIMYAALNGPFVGAGLTKLVDFDASAIAGGFNVTGSGGTGLAGIGLIGALIALVFAILLIITKIVLIAGLALAFVLGPILIPFWIFEQTAWVARTVLQMLLGLLLWPMVWAFGFALFAVLATSPFGLGSLASIAQPLVLVAALAMAWKVPTLLMRQAMAAGLMPTMRGTAMQAMITYREFQSFTAGGAAAEGASAATEAAGAAA